MGINGLGKSIFDNRLYGMSEKNNSESSIFADRLYKVQSENIESVLEKCQVRNISAEDSDNVKIDIFNGRVLKAKVLDDGKTVYVEEKNDDGEVNGYEVDSTKIDKSSKDIISQLIAETMEKFENQLKNGEPKYSIGGSEFSIKEWDRLIASVDDTLEDAKEELESRIEKEKLKKLDEKLEERQLEIEKNAKRFVSERMGMSKKAPYSYLADENGIIEYKGAIFQCDDEKQLLTLGDVSDDSKVITIPLSSGGMLKVNRENLDELAGAIDMFSPEDINLIMRAIAQDAKLQQMQKEIDETVNGIGKGSQNELERFVEVIYEQLNSVNKDSNKVDVSDIGKTVSIDEVITSIIETTKGDAEQNSEDYRKNVKSDLTKGYMDFIFESVDSLVKEAWSKTAKEMKMNGYDMSSEYTKYVTQLQLEQLNKDRENGKVDDFGNDIEGTRRFVEASINSLSNYINTTDNENLRQAAKIELEFYEKLQGKL